MNGQSDGLKMKQSFNATEFRNGQVNGGWRFGSMTTMRLSTPDALDGRVEEGECQTTKSQRCIPNFSTNSSGTSATGIEHHCVLFTLHILLTRIRFNNHHATSRSISFTIKDSAKRLTKHKFSAAANGGIHYCLQKAPTTLFFSRKQAIQ